MTNCFKCGNEITADAAFCPNCGQPMAPKAPATGGDPGLMSLSGLETVLPEKREPQTTGSLLEEGSEFHGRYRVSGRIGAGAMGVVYLAEDKVTSREVALKLISPALIQSPTAVQRFLREGLTARDIRHSNVIAMYDVGDDDGQLFLVMEYLEGDNLRGWLHKSLQRGEDVPFATARDITVGILEGLKAAHETGVIHRDLKPENIMLLGDPGDGDFRLKILDFGIARAIDTGKSAQLTTTGMATGTPLYMAPEQRTAADTVTPSADLYAVATIFYELLMGVTPEGRWSPPSKERDDISAFVDAVIDKGLSSRPRSRYQSADEFLDALKGDVRPQPDPKPGPDPRPPDSDLDRHPEPPPHQDRKSGNKLLKIGIAAVGILVLAVIGLMEEYDSGVVYDDGGSFQDDLTSISEPPPPPPPPAAQISGLWYDELYGYGSAHAYVELQQSGNRITGQIFDMDGDTVGSISGSMDGTTLSYSYSAGSLGNGSGVGRLRADNTHIDIVVTADSGGIGERHVLHRNHLPGS